MTVSVKEASSVLTVPTCLLVRIALLTCPTRFARYLAHDSTQAATGAESMRTGLYTRALDILSGANREWFVSAAAGI